jgi:hypothetical protein
MLRIGQRLRVSDKTLTVQAVEDDLVLCRVRTRAPARGKPATGNRAHVRRGKRRGAARAERRA